MKLFLALIVFLLAIIVLKQFGFLDGLFGSPKAPMPVQQQPASVCDIHKGNKASYDACLRRQTR